jgi:oligopeptide transport system substrate-binding protein
MTADVYDNIIPGLAESYTVNEDKTVYTFKLREGLQYVNYLMEPVGEMTAEDFVTVAEYVCNPAHAINSPYFTGTIAGADDYIAGTTTDFSTVGFKALDKYTLEITLVRPIPYWLQTTGSYMPTYTPFLLEHGEEYGVDHTKLLSIGPYVLTDFQPQYRRVFEKNPYYYDKDNVFIEKITDSYNAESATVAPQMFLMDETDYADISADLIDQWMTSDETKDIIVPALPDTTYQYWYSFCFLPAFDADLYDMDSYLLAIDNEAFRQSLFWGFNRQTAIKGLDPYPTGEIRLVNTIVAPTWAYDEEGVAYTDTGALAEISARPNWQFDPEKALEYRDQAIEELTAAGATLPIQLYCPYNPATDGWSNELEIMVQQLTELLGEDYVKFTIEAGPSVGFLADVRRTGKYGFMKLNMGGGYRDPQAFTPGFDIGNNWTFMDQATTPNVQALYAEYAELLAAAKEIVDDNTTRFEAFAEAEAFLINHALVIPYTSDTNGYFVSRTNYLEGWGAGGYKGRRVLVDPLTTEQFNALYADWLVEKEASMVQ